MHLGRPLELAGAHQPEAGRAVLTPGQEQPAARAAHLLWRLQRVAAIDAAAGVVSADLPPDPEAITGEGVADPAAPLPPGAPLPHYDPYRAASPYNPIRIDRPVPDPALNLPNMTLCCDIPNQNLGPYTGGYWGRDGSGGGHGCGHGFLHGHKGGGIRCLLEGALEVTVGDRAPRLMRPGDAWFESGREPVLAKASPEMPTAFVRVSILPREIRGQSSIVYVDPADAARGRPRQYTVYVDEPLILA